jgi:aspartate kinase
MIIMKFGGTSVADAGAIERVAEIVRKHLEKRPVIVVSAMGKTTRLLLDAAEASAKGDAPTSRAILVELQENHMQVARPLIRSTNGHKVFELVESYFDELTKLSEGLAILGEVPPRGLDKILSYGELLSSAIVAGALAERNIATRLLDAREFLITDDSFGEASPLFEIANQKIRETITPVLASGGVPIIQGFIGSTRDGATTTLGFEGSDYTAAIVGAALEAEDIQIWKDVSGLMTADPAMLGDARTVKICTFEEAAELTFFGAKVLHPKAILPAAQKNIPVHIYNSKQPDATGTTITATASKGASLIKSIAYKRPVMILHLALELNAPDQRSPSADNILTTLLETLSKRRLKPLLTGASASAVALALDSHALNPIAERDLAADLAHLGRFSSEPRKAIVTLVGEGLRSDRAAVSRVFRALDNIDLRGIILGPSPIGMSLLLDERDVEGAVARLHSAFFQELDPEVFE